MHKADLSTVPLFLRENRVLVKPENNYVPYIQQMQRNLWLTKEELYVAWKFFYIFFLHILFNCYHLYVNFDIYDAWLDQYIILTIFKTAKIELYHFSIIRLIFMMQTRPASPSVNRSQDSNNFQKMTYVQIISNMLSTGCHD